MFTDNTIHKINKNNPAEMDRNGSKAYRVPIQFPVIAQVTLFCYFWKRAAQKGEIGEYGESRCGVQIGVEC